MLIQESNAPFQISVKMGTDLASVPSGRKYWALDVAVKQATRYAHHNGDFVITVVDSMGKVVHAC